jgi:hypothetical protein
MAFAAFESRQRIIEMQVLERAGHRRRRGERAGEALAAGDQRLAPHQLLEPVLWRHPRPARLAPAGRSCDRHLQTKLVGKPRGVVEHLLPLRRHVNDPVINDLRRHQAGVEIGETADAGALHPFQILADAFLRDVAVHPVPPDTRAGALRRFLEAFRQRIVRRRCRRRLRPADGGDRQRGKRNADPDRIAHRLSPQIALARAMPPSTAALGLGVRLKLLRSTATSPCR